uniref:SAP domain-containing protein n=1 Tax=Parastrongyloides trichosuri TaxID=131310 RepID=A0A0N4ZVM4_PARTI
MNTRRKSARLGPTNNESSDPQLNAILIPLLPVVRLREELSKRGLKSTGRKDVLIERLVEYVEHNGIGYDSTTTSTTNDISSENIKIEIDNIEQNDNITETIIENDSCQQDSIKNTDNDTFIIKEEVPEKNTNPKKGTSKRKRSSIEKSTRKSLRLKNSNKNDNETEESNTHEEVEETSQDILEIKHDDSKNKYVKEETVEGEKEIFNEKNKNAVNIDVVQQEIKIVKAPTIPEKCLEVKRQVFSSNQTKSKNNPSFSLFDSILENQTDLLFKTFSEEERQKNLLDIAMEKSSSITFDSGLPPLTKKNCIIKDINNTEDILNESKSQNEVTKEQNITKRKRRLFEEPKLKVETVPPPETIVNLVEHYNNTIYGNNKSYSPLTIDIKDDNNEMCEKNNLISPFETTTPDGISPFSNACDSISSTDIDSPCPMEIDENVKNIFNQQNQSETVKNILKKVSLNNLFKKNDNGYVIDDNNMNDEYIPSSSAIVKEEEKNPEDQQKKLNELMIKDPTALLQKASAVLKNINEHVDCQYEQFPCEDKFVEEVKPLPDFHGEPVHSDEEEEDYFAKAAGIKKKKDKNAVFIPEEEEPPLNDAVELDYYNADLHIKASLEDKWHIEPENCDGFALMWGGIRSNYGIKYDKSLNSYGKKFCFQVKISDHLSLKHVPFEEREPYDIRIGWSLNNKSQALGDLPGSYCINSRAMRASSCIFSDFGEPFGIGDIITTILDISRGQIAYYKNDEYLGIAFDQTCFKDNDAIFAHIGIKNCKVKVNFGHGSEEDFPSKYIPKGVYFISAINCFKEMVRSREPPAKKEDCTVIMTVGLPGSGKTTWVRQYLKDNPDGNWRVISSDALLQQMRIDGIPRKQAHNGRWDMVMGLAAKAVIKAMGLACRRKHNYIIDGTNVSRDARKRKLAQFQDFQRKCVVLIPPEKELIHRQMKQEKQDGVRPIPAEAMLELKATMSVPELDEEPVEDIIFIEPEQISHALKIVENYNKEGEPWLIQKNKQKRQKHNAQINNHSVNN